MNNLGVVQQKLEKPEQAYCSFANALKIDSEYMDALNNIGNLMVADGRLNEALVYFKKVIELDAQNSEAHYNLGVTYQKAKVFSKAKSSYTRSLELDANNIEAYNNLGIMDQVESKFEEAIIHFKKAIEINPKYAYSYYNLGNVYKKVGNISDAIKSYKTAIKVDPGYDHARHMLNALMGNLSKTAPLGYIENLFDEYSESFEESLINTLKYNTPKILGDILKKKLSNKNKISIVDLGCGTGLTGLQLKSISNTLHGVDIASGMLKEAKKKNVYDKLYKINIEEFLTTVNINFDLFVATDVFIYVGDLSRIFELIKSRNSKNGQLAFSTEHLETGNYKLEKSGRFSHSKNYIESLCTKYNYNLDYFSKIKFAKR